MLMTPVVLALATLGAGAPESVPMVATRVRVLEMKDLSWRTAAHGFLTPVARQNGATVWTATGGILKVLSHTTLDAIEAPKVTSVAGMPATVQAERTRLFVADVRITGDAKTDDAVSKVAFRPDVDRATDGCQIEVTTRSIDQGTLAEIRLKSRRVGAIHTVTVEDPRGDGAKNRLKAAYQVPEVVEETVAGEWVIPKEGFLVIGLGPRTITDKDGKPAVRERVVVVQAKAVVAPVALRPGAPVAGREVVYASPAFAVEPGSRVMFESAPAPGRAVTTFGVNNGRIQIHPVYVLATLPWGVLPGPVASAAQAHIVGIGGQVIRPGLLGDADQMVRRTAAEVEPSESGPMPRVPSRHLPGTITPDGTRAILPPLPDHGPDPASYDHSGDPLPSPQSSPHHFENVKIHGKVVIRGMDGVELIAEGLTIRTLPKSDASVAPTSATLKEPEPVTPPCCETSDKTKPAGWSKPKEATAKPDVAVGATPLKVRLPNTKGAVELEIHAGTTPPR